MSDVIATVRRVWTLASDRFVENIVVSVTPFVDVLFSINNSLLFIRTSVHIVAYSPFSGLPHPPLYCISSIEGVRLWEGRDEGGGGLSSEEFVNSVRYRRPSEASKLSQYIAWSR